MINTINSNTQSMPVFTRIPSLPGGEGWAGMYAGEMEGIAARVTLPVVYWNGHWTYISGEVKPGIRSDAIYKISNN